MHQRQVSRVTGVLHLHKHVRRLHVHVEHALAVRTRERVRQCGDDPQQRLRRQRAPLRIRARPQHLQRPLQRPGEALHDQRAHGRTRPLRGHAAGAAEAREGGLAGGALKHTEHWRNVVVAAQHPTCAELRVDLLRRHVIVAVLPYKLLHDDCRSSAITRQCGLMDLHSSADGVGAASLFHWVWSGRRERLLCGLHGQQDGSQVYAS